MKLISLIGNDPLKVILPLTQLTNLIDGAYFLVTKNNYPMAERILNYLKSMDQDEEGPGWDQAIEIIVFGKDSDYTEIYWKIREILDGEYARNEEAAFNYDGGNKPMQRAARSAARDMLAPLLSVDTKRFHMRLSWRGWDRKTIVTYGLPCKRTHLPLFTALSLIGLDFKQEIRNKASKGFRYLFTQTLKGGSEENYSYKEIKYHV